MCLIIKVLLMCKMCRGVLFSEKMLKKDSQSQAAFLLVCLCCCSALLSSPYFLLSTSSSIVCIEWQLHCGHSQLSHKLDAQTVRMSCRAWRTNAGRKDGKTQSMLPLVDTWCNNSCLRMNLLSFVLFFFRSKTYWFSWECPVESLLRHRCLQCDTDILNIWLMRGL